MFLLMNSTMKGDMTDLRESKAATNILSCCEPRAHAHDGISKLFDKFSAWFMTVQ